MNFPCYQLNFQASLVTMEMGISWKDMIALLGILSMLVDKPNILHHVTKVVVDNIGSII